MKAPWHLLEPERLSDLRRRVVDQFPTLRFIVDDERVVMTGTYSVYDGATHIESFRVLVELPDEFPRALPVVYELDGKIPSESRFHRNAGDDTLCVVLPDEYWFERSECDLIDYLEGPLRNYFLGFVHYRDVGEWPFGEHGHGADGVREFYSNVLGTTDVDRVLGYLELLAADQLTAGMQCPCGSGVDATECHWTQILELRAKVRPSVAALAIDRIRREI